MRWVWKFCTTQLQPPWYNDTYVYLGRCTSWNLQAGQTETIVAAAFTRRPPCSYIGCSWEGGERDTMCLTRKWFGFVTHQTQICHHMLGFVRQQTQICHRILHLLVTANTDSLVVWQAHSWFKTECKTLYLYKSTKEGRSLAKLVCLWFWMCALSHPVVFASIREAILCQIGCFFTHCVKGGGGVKPMCKNLCCEFV